MYACAFTDHVLSSVLPDVANADVYLQSPLQHDQIYAINSTDQKQTDTIKFIYTRLPIHPTTTTTPPPAQEDSWLAIIILAILTFLPVLMIVGTFIGFIFVCCVWKDSYIHTGCQICCLHYKK